MFKLSLIVLLQLFLLLIKNVLLKSFNFLDKGTIKTIANKKKITFGYTHMNVPPLINTNNFKEASDLIALENKLIIEFYCFFNHFYGK